MGSTFFYGGRVAPLETDPMAAGAGHAARKHARLLWFVAGIVSVDRVNTCCGILLSYRHDFTPMSSAPLEVLYLILESLAASLLLAAPPALPSAPFLLGAEEPR